MVPTATLVRLMIGAAFAFALPVALLVWWRRTRRARLAPFFVGAAVFAVFALGLETLAHRVFVFGDNAVSRAARNATIEIPEAMLNTRAEQSVNNFARQLASQGMSLDQYMQFTGTNMETLREQVKPQTEIQIRNELVLDEVAKAENIEVTDDEILKEVEEMAKAYGMDFEKMKEVLTDEEKENFRKDLAARKAMDLIADAAVEVDMPEEEAAADKEAEE